MHGDTRRVAIFFGLGVVANLLWAGYYLTDIPSLYYLGYGTGIAAIADMIHFLIYYAGITQPDYT